MTGSFNELEVFSKKVRNYYLTLKCFFSNSVVWNWNENFIKNFKTLLASTTTSNRETNYSAFEMWGFELSFCSDEPRAWNFRILVSFSEIAACRDNIILFEFVTKGLVVEGYVWRLRSSVSLRSNADIWSFFLNFEFTPFVSSLCLSVLKTAKP